MSVQHVMQIVKNALDQIKTSVIIVILVIFCMQNKIYVMLLVLLLILKILQHKIVFLVKMDAKHVIHPQQVVLVV